MTSFQPGDVVLVAFPFTSGTEIKVRPALVILDTGDADVLIARTTTQSYNTAYDVPLSGWRSAGLIVASVVRLHKLVTVHKAKVFQSLGRLQDSDRQAVSTAMKRVYGDW
jgi:mRNA interferase MazF